MILLFLLMILAALSAYYALTPLVYSAQKTRQMKEESQTFYENTELVQQEPHTYAPSWTSTNLVLTPVVFLAQTSIPIGGENSNSVIAGHRSWNGYKYFLDIELLEAGDLVYITNLWGTLTYRVTEIQIINPNEIDAILIRPGKDMITLLTCHPYGSGGLYRYLVFCERV